MLWRESGPWCWCRGHCRAAEQFTQAQHFIRKSGAEASQDTNFQAVACNHTHQGLQDFWPVGFWKVFLGHDWHFSVFLSLAKVPAGLQQQVGADGT